MTTETPESYNSNLRAHAFFMLMPIIPALVGFVGVVKELRNPSEEFAPFGFDMSWDMSLVTCLASIVMIVGTNYSLARYARKHKAAVEAQLS